MEPGGIREARTFGGSELAFAAALGFGETEEEGLLAPSSPSKRSAKAYAG